MTFRPQLVLITALLTFPTCSQAQRPIQPFCSNNPLDKLPACTAPATAAPAPPSRPAPATNDVNTQFPFPGSEPPAAPATSPKPSVADQFPFPGSEPPTAPATSAKPGVADQFPFPGEQAPAPVLDPTEKPYQPDPPSANPFPGSSSSSSSSSSSNPNDPQPDSQPALKDEGSEGTSRASRRRVLPKVEDLEAREEEDVRIANYYHSTGNFLAAYNRAKDAVRLAPDDAEAHIALAMNAQKLAKRDEAAAAYTAYLKLDPKGPHAKAAQKALAGLH